LFADPEVSAVAIATPAPTHFALARAALLAGKDAFVEKPLALEVRDARELTDLALDSGRVLMVGHLLLYQPAITWMHRWLASGQLGEVYSLHQERLNLGTARPVENALWSLGVHDIAVLLYLTGSEPTGVQVSGQRVLGEAVEDDVTVHLEFAGGVQAHLHTSWLWPEKRRRLLVVGSAGMLAYDELDGRVVLHRKGIGPDLKSWDHGSEEVFRASGEPLRLELQHFLDRLQDRQKPLSDGASSLPVLRVLERASLLLNQRSFSTGERRCLRKVG
jgi:predicted dehydrogenase